MRILFISTNPASSWGGSEELWAATARKAMAAGHTVGLSLFKLMAANKPVLTLAEEGAHLHRRPVRGKSRVAEITYKFYDPYRSIASFRPDVIAINQGGTFECVFHGEFPHIMRLIERTGAAYIPICHGNTESDIPPDSLRGRARAFFGGAYRVAFVAERMARLAERQLAAKLPNAVVVQNPVNLADKSPVAWPGDGGVGGPARFALVARQDNLKGIEVLLEVLTAPVWRGREWVLELAGSGHCENYYKELTTFLGLDDRVKHLGYQKDIRAIWARNHVLLLPSRTEGLPLVLVESMLCARPSLMTDTGGVAEWLEDGKTGWLLEACSTRSLAACMERVWADRPRWRAMGEAAHARADAMWNRDPGGAFLDLMLAAGASKGRK